MFGCFDEANRGIVYQSGGLRRQIRHHEELGAQAKGIKAAGQVRSLMSRSGGFKTLDSSVPVELLASLLVCVCVCVASQEVA